jgi:hypothetical protein
MDHGNCGIGELAAGVLIAKFVSVCGGLGTNFAI